MSLALTCPDLPWPEAVLFDADGTLLDSADFLLAAHNHVRDVYGLPRFTHEDFHDMISSTTREIYAALYGERASEAQKILYKYVNENQDAALRALPGAEETLAFLATRGIPMGVVSNKNQASLEAAIARLGWGPYFGVVVGAGGPIPGKPSPEPLFHALKGLNIPRELVDRVWMVGDHNADIGCARAAGAVGILVAYRWGDAIQKSCKPHLALPGLRSLQEVVTALTARQGEFVPALCEP